MHKILKKLSHRELLSFTLIIIDLEQQDTEYTAEMGDKFTEVMNNQTANVREAVIRYMLQRVDKHLASGLQDVLKKDECKCHCNTEHICKNCV